jgi:hypothetical protein
MMKGDESDMKLTTAASAPPATVGSMVILSRTLGLLVASLSTLSAAEILKAEVPVVQPTSVVEDHGRANSEDEADSSRQADPGNPEKSRGPIVMGLDLSSAPSRTRSRDLPDLFEPSPEQPGKLRGRRDVFPMPLTKDRTKSIWLKYPVTLGRFYIQYRSDRSKPETERTYGPFDGDPFERFKLEEIMTGRLQSSYSPDDIFRIKLMLRTDDVAMAHRAARLMHATLAAETSAREKRLYLHSFREILKDFAATFEKHALDDEVRGMKGQLASLEAEIEALTAVIPDEQYTTAEAIKDKLTAEIPARAWGESHKGLRLAAVPDPDSVKLGELIPFKVIVENAGDQTVKFSAFGLLQSARADVRRTNGDQVETRTTLFTGVSPIERYLIRPSERVVVVQPSIMVVEKLEGSPSRPGCTMVPLPGNTDLRNHVYVVRYSIRLGGNESWSRGDDGVMRRVSPAKGEWIGTLTSAPVAIAASRD